MSQIVGLRTLREATGNWNAAMMLDAGIILTSFVLLLFVREPRGEREKSSYPHRHASNGNLVERGPDMGRVVLQAKEKQHVCAHR